MKLVHFDDYHMKVYNTPFSSFHLPDEDDKEIMIGEFFEGIETREERKKWSARMDLFLQILQILKLFRKEVQLLMKKCGPGVIKESRLLWRTPCENLTLLKYIITDLIGRLVIVHHDCNAII